MHWIQIILETSREQCEALEETLLDLGALSVTYVDAADQPLFEPDLGETPLWDAVRLTGLYPADAPMDTVIAQLKDKFGDSLPKHRTEILEDKDWIREWMDQFQPMQFGEHLWIVPSWSEPPHPDAINLMLDPGLAFGTGTHATTALCLQWLDANPPKDQLIIDYGCGSGVLGIAALLLGADNMLGIDIDPQALLATRQNAEQNNIAENRYHVYLPGQAPEQQAETVLANILAGPLVELTTEIGSRVKPDGKLILSGILNNQAQMVINAYQDRFDFEPVAEQDGWVRLVGTRHA